MQCLYVAPVRKKTRPTPGTGHKPFNEIDRRAKRDAELYLHLAKVYAGRGDNRNAASCCESGFLTVTSVARPLAVRDQLHDLVQQLEANLLISR
ncbi:MAG TPA: hypothetical protein VKZ53_23820 [Candidatus Angelobacter sp.]|nr:hypothetical protein [Candidatus Angelobacter sp.]